MPVTKAWRSIALLAGASLVQALQIIPALRLPAPAGAPFCSLWAHGVRAGYVLRGASRPAVVQKRVCLGPVFKAVSDGAESARDAEELQTGVQLRTPDVDKLCSWLTEEITLWLDQDWIERDVHRAMGERAAATVRRMVESGDVGISAILFGVAEDLGAANFPRLFESDVNEWDVANKVSDLLLQSMCVDVCCTTAPLTGLPDYGIIEPAAIAGAAESQGGFQAPESSVDKYVFLQKSLDGRILARELNAAVLLTLRYAGVICTATSGLDPWRTDARTDAHCPHQRRRRQAHGRRRQI